MKDLVRSRHQVDQYYNMASQLKGMSMTLGSMKATAEINSALRSATQTMTHVNEKMSIKQVQEIMKAFAKEQEKFSVGQEMV
jgi:type VI protein secretion system component VasF